MATQTATRIETRQIELKSRPSGVPTEDNFRLDIGFIEPLVEGEFLVQNEWMSVDPYMRGRMKDTDRSGWIASGQIVWEESITQGLENAPSAFIGLFTGKNIGKALVRIESEPFV